MRKTIFGIIVLIAVIGLVVQTLGLIQALKYLNISELPLFYVPLTVTYIFDSVFAFLWIREILAKRYTSFMRLLILQMSLMVFMVWLFSVVTI